MDGNCVDELKAGWNIALVLSIHWYPWARYRWPIWSEVTYIYVITKDIIVIQAFYIVFGR